MYTKFSLTVHVQEVMQEASDSDVKVGFAEMVLL